MQSSQTLLSPGIEIAHIKKCKPSTRNAWFWMKYAVLPRSHNTRAHAADHPIYAAYAANTAYAA